MNEAPDFYGRNRTGLAKCLKGLLSQPDFFTVSKEKILGYLASIMQSNGYICVPSGEYLCISVEEFVIRSHIDPYNPKRFKTMDVFVYKNHANTLGIDPAKIDQAILSLQKQELLTTGLASDGQAYFSTTRINGNGPVAELILAYWKCHNPSLCSVG